MSEGNYYVPEQSKLPIFASLGMGLMAFGAASWVNSLSAEGGSDPWIFLTGSFVMAVVLWNWFNIVITENMAGLNSAQLKKSYVLGMSWFIFSEVMFFAAFFGALFYMRHIALPGLAGEGAREMTNSLLWPGFENQWPLMTTPDQAVSGESAQFKGPAQSMGWHGIPLWNTIILLTSSVTIHIAHTAIKKNARAMFNLWLFITVALGATFLVMQVYEYHHAYVELGLTLETGAYGTTFFMLTGFHGAHVTMGTFMLLVMLLRSVIKGHFKADDNFGFEAASWYWHFVDVVWLGLFIFVYILGS